MTETKDDLFCGTLLEEISIINRQGHFLDGEHEKLPAERLLGELTLFEKSLFTFYKRNMLKLRDLERDLCGAAEPEPAVRQAMELARNILKEKTKIASRLFAFQVRSRFNVWEGTIVSLRRGFQLVEVETHWTKEVRRPEAASVIRKELKVAIPRTGHA